MGLVFFKQCTLYYAPFEEDGTNTQLHFSKMWFDLLIASDSFFRITKGKSNPYSWRTGNYCDYNVGASRDPYTNVTTKDILKHASRDLCFS